MAAPSFLASPRGCGEDEVEGRAGGGQGRGGKGEGRGGRREAEGRGGRGRAGDAEEGGGAERGDGRRRGLGRGGRRGRGRAGRATMPELSFVSAPSRRPPVSRPVSVRRRLNRSPLPRPCRAPRGSAAPWVTSQFRDCSGDHPVGSKGQRGSHAHHRESAVATLKAIPSHRLLPLQFVGCSSSSKNIHRFPGAWSSKTAHVVNAANHCKDSETSLLETSPAVSPRVVSPHVELSSVASPSVRSTRGPDWQPRCLSLERNCESRQCRSLESEKCKKSENGHCNGLTKVRLGSLTAVHGNNSENGHLIHPLNSPCKISENSHPRDPLKGREQYSENSYFINSHSSPCTSSENRQLISLGNRASQSGNRKHAERAEVVHDTNINDSSTRLLLELSMPSVLTPNCSHCLPADKSVAIDVGSSPSGGTASRDHGKGADGGTGTLLRQLLLLGNSEGTSPPLGGPVLAEDTPEEQGVRAGFVWRRRRMGWAAGTGVLPVSPR